MDTEHARPLYAFFVVSLVAGMLMGQNLRGESFLDLITGSPARQTIVLADSGGTISAADPAPVADARKTLASVVARPAPRGAAPQRTVRASTSTAATPRRKVSAAAAQSAAGTPAKATPAPAQGRAHKPTPKRGRVSTTTRSQRLDASAGTSTRARAGRGR